MQLLIQNNFTHNIQQEISHCNESTFFHPGDVSASIDESKVLESVKFFEEIIQKPNGCFRSRISVIKKHRPRDSWSIMRGGKV